MRPVLKFFLALSCIILHPILSTSDEGGNEERYDYQLEGSQLNALVNVQGGVYLSQGHPAGFHFELLKKFASHQKCNISISPTKENDPWKELINGNVDILVVNAATDTIPEYYQDKVISSLELNNQEHVWVVLKENYHTLQSLNYWFGYFNHTNEYNNLSNKYFKNYIQNRFSNVPVTILSPYDQIIKEYAVQLGWDWRLLASLIYQESKFRISAHSRRNAHGLMQLLPSTANTFDIDDLFDPEQNIKAGTLFLKRLSNLYSSSEIDSINRIKFILAAYNAGEGRVEDIRRVAQYKNINTYKWDSIKAAIPYMNRVDELPDTLLRHGKFKGIETINYVDEIIDRYENYKVLVKK